MKENPSFAGPERAIAADPDDANVSIERRTRARRPRRCPWNGLDLGQ